MTMLQHAILVLILPLGSAAVIALFLRRAGGLAAAISVLTSAAIAVIAVILALHHERFEDSFEWLRLGDFAISIGVKYDDLAALISNRLPLVIGAVLAFSFVVLLLAFRSVLVPLKAILCNLLAVGAAFGVLTVVFQWGWGLSLVGLANPYGTVPIASYVPLLMFAVLFGMSTDYEVFLLSQIFQAHAAGQGSHEAVRSGVGTSARVITAAALIMITVFASFILNIDPVIKQFGVGLSIAILLDATIVRMVIVPATMVLLGDWNWWLPRWLRWLPRVDVPEEGAGRAAEQPATET